MKQKFVFSTLLMAFCMITKAQQQYYLVTGTYTSDKSEGIYVYRFNSNDGTAKAVSSVKISNPSFVAVSPDERFVYSVEEDAANNGKGGEISAFSFDKKTGTLAFLNRQQSGGDHPCYVSVDKTGKWIAAGNYTSGSLSILPVEANGSLGAATTIIKHEGSGLNKTRQASPHVHCTFFSADNRFLFVPDLGIDKVMIYAFEESTGKLTGAKQPFAASEPGSGRCRRSPGFVCPAQTVLVRRRTSAGCHCQTTAGLDCEQNCRCSCRWRWSGTPELRSD